MTMTAKTLYRCLLDGAHLTWARSGDACVYSWLEDIDFARPSTQIVDKAIEMGLVYKKGAGTEGSIELIDNEGEIDE